MIRNIFSAAGLLLAATVIAQAQITAANSPIQITAITPSFETSPNFSTTIGPQRKARSQNWLWIEVSFTYKDKSPRPFPLDDLKLNYYILLNDKSPTNRTGTLLTGSVSHTGIISGTDTHHSVMLISPQVLQRFFAGKMPGNAQTATQAIGVTATVSGQMAGELSIGAGKGTPQWWTRFQQGPPGLVLGKDQTPFAPLFYDYFEATKAQTPGN